MKTIPLTQGFEAMVDDADYEWLSQWKWHVNKCSKSGNLYAMRTETVAPRRERVVMMHRLINQTPDGLLTDHEDGNGLNNQRHNLRTATKAQNMQNKSAHRNNRSGVTGVHWHSSSQKWRAKISHDGRQIEIGSFERIEDAAAARAIAERQYGYHPNHGRK